MPRAEDSPYSQPLTLWRAVLATAVLRAADGAASAMAELVERLDVGHALDLDAARRRALGSSGLAQPEVSSARVESKVVHAKGA